MNPQAIGSVTLRSSNPSDHPKIDSNLINHPFDRRVLIEAVRKAMEFLNTPVFREKTVKMIGVPEGGVKASDDEIWVSSSLSIFRGGRWEGGWRAWELDINYEGKWTNKMIGTLSQQSL